jgi:hypothetical protein
VQGIGNVKRPLEKRIDQAVTRAEGFAAFECSDKIPHGSGMFFTINENAGTQRGGMQNDAGTCRAKARFTQQVGISGRRWARV